MHPRVVLPQSSTRKRLLDPDENEKDLQKVISPPKRLRYDDSQQFVTKTTFECYNNTRPFTITTDIKIDHSSSVEQTLPLTTNTPSKVPMMTHRFISKKIFKPETCFVVSAKKKHFFPISYLCKLVSQTDQFRFGIISLFILFSIKPC